jgi:hypothetical protein
MRIFVMGCPDCEYIREFAENVSYTQDDLMCPTHQETSLVRLRDYEVEDDPNPIEEVTNDHTGGDEEPSDKKAGTEP